MVLALDLRDAATAHAVYALLSTTNDSLNRPYTEDALFKVPAIAFNSGNAVSVDLIGSTFSLGYQAGPPANLQPVFNTGDIQPAAYGSEENVGAALQAFRTATQSPTPYVNIPAVEIQYKQNGGNLTNFVNDTKQLYPISVFSPYMDFIPTASVPGQFYTTYGYCCVSLSAFFSPGDTADNRGDINFDLSNGFKQITRDDAEDFRIELYQKGLRNLTYITNNRQSPPPPQPGQPPSSGGGGGTPPTDPNAPPAGADPLPPFTPGETGTRRPDPSAIYTNGVYYSVESNDDTNPGLDTIYLRQASSLAGLAGATPSPIYTDSAHLGELWAPEIMYINGSFYVYFTMGSGSAHRMYVISSASATGGYTGAQQLNLPGNTWAIDGTTFSYNGQRWFAWSGWPGSTDGEQDIYLAKMNDPVTPTGDRYQISQPHEPWEQASGTALLVNEGVEAIKDPNGQLHIVYSANDSFTDQYCLGDLRLQVSGDPTNVWDWHKSNGCLFGSNGGNMEPDGWYPTLYVNGPGHHTFALPDGDINKSPDAAYPHTADLMYHAVPKGLNYSWANRVTYVGAYTWYNNINYNRCCVPGTNTDTGYSLMFFEDPGFAPHPPPAGPPAGGGSGGGGGGGGSVPGSTGIHNADPSVIRVGDSTYYSVETWNNQTAIALRQASSPAGLGTATPTVLFQYSSGTTAIWAPEISVVDGGYIVYFSADIGAGHRMFYAKFASDFTPAGGGQLSLPDDQWAVDGNAFVFGGQRFFVWSGTEPGDPNEQNLYVVVMSNPTTPTGPRYRISQPHEAWERVTGGPPNNYINEAPAAIIDPDGRLHIVYSANGSWTEQYCLGDLRLVAGGYPTNVWDWHKSNGCQFGSNASNMAPDYDATLYVNGPGSHSFVLLNGDIGFSPTAAAPVPLMYHAVPKGTPYSWDNRQWFNGAFQWFHGPDYTRCCVPGSTDDAGWSIKFYEDPNFGK